MKKKFFSVFLSVLTIITQLNLPVNAVAEETATPDESENSSVIVSNDDENKTNEEKESEEVTNESEEGETSEETASTDKVEKGTTDEDPFTYTVTYDDDFSKATITISYGKEDADYIDLDNADDFQEKAEAGVIAVNDEKTSGLSLAFDVNENGDYDMKVSAYKDSEVVANSEKTVNVTDIGTKEVDSKEAEEETTPVANESIAEASISDIAGYISNSDTFAFLIGNKANDELWQRILAAYSKIQEEYSGSYSTVFYELQGEGDISSIVNFANDAEDVSAIESAYQDLTTGSTGHGIIAFVFNNRIVHVVVESDDTDEYTVDEQAVIEWRAKYVQGTKTRIAPDSVISDIMTASIVSNYVPNVLSVSNVTNQVGSSAKLKEVMQSDGTVKTYLQLDAANGAYTFTAPESGWYYVTLWGADGDSDAGVKTSSYASYSANDDGKGNAWTAGVGGQGGTVTGYIHLNKNEQIYLALGYANGMSGKRLYGQGGIGTGQSTGYRSGGGGYGAIYSALKGNGELKNYSNNGSKTEGDSSILMVAGGGGGAEDFYTASWKNNTYYCSYNVCSNAYGGNGGKNPTTGYVPSQNSATGATADSGVYTGGSFGDGESYAAYHNASSGGGGAGYGGGKSAHTPAGGSGQYGSGGGATVELETSLRGGTGAGGTSYVNTSASNVKNVTFIDGDNSRYGTLWPSAQNAGATIEVYELDQHTLTINYYDINTSTNPIASGSEDASATKVKESVVKTITTGDSYSITSDVVDGYTLANNFKGKVDGRDDDSVIEGTMPDSDLVINVYYDYSSVTVNYYEWDSINGVGTTNKLADSKTENIKKGDTYIFSSPSVDGYVFYYENSVTVEADGVTNHDGHFSTVVSGTKSGANQTYNVYFVKEFSPRKHIEYVNGVAIPEEICEAGVQLKVGDVVTYQIDYQNNQFEAVTKTLTDNLPSGLNYIDGTATNDENHVATTSTTNISWNVNIDGASSKSGQAVNGFVQFQAKVVSANNGAEVQNTAYRELVEEAVSYKVTKSSDPESGSEVTTKDFITYTIKVENTGEHAIKNIVVIDEIPANTEFSYIDNDSAVNYNGVSKDGYVKFVIDELASSGVAYLKFTVRVTGEGTATSKENATQIINVAKYQNYQETQSKDDDSKDQDIIDNGNKTNETVHYLMGAKITAVKSSTPVSGSTVKAGDTIHYSIDLVNAGEVTANYVRVTDDIPAGTTFVDGSLKLSGDVGSYKQQEVWSVFGFNGGVSTVADTYTVEHPETNIYSNKTYSAKFADSTNDASGARTSSNLESSSGASASSGAYVSTSWSGQIWASNCSGCDSSFYGNPSYHNKKIIAYGSTNGSNWDTLFTANAYKKGAIETSAGSGSQRYKYFKVELSGNCWQKFKWDINVTYTYKVLTSHTDAWTEAVTSGYHISSANVNVTGGTVSSVVVTSSNTNWNYSGVDTSKFSVSASGGTLTLTPKTQGSVGNVSSADINNALKAISWTGTTSPNASVKVNGSNVKTGYSDSSSSCKYVTNNGTSYVECIGTNVAKGKAMKVEFDVTVNNDLASTFKIENVGKYETYQVGTDIAGQKTTKPTEETNKTVHNLQDENPSVVATKSSNPVSGSQIERDEKITYILSFTNNGNVPIKYLQVRDSIPEFATFSSIITSGGVYVANGGDNNRGYVEWVLTDIPVGETRTVQFTVKADSSMTTADSIVNIAYYQIYNENPGEAGNISNAPTNATNKTIHSIRGVAPILPDTTLTKSSNPVSGSTVHRQDEIEYTLTLSNEAKGLQDFILVEDKIPSGTTFKEIKEYTGATASKDLEVRSYYSENDKAVRYIVSNLKGEDTVELHFIVTVDKEIQLSEIVNTAKYLTLNEVENSSDIKKYDLNNKDTVDFQTLDNPKGDKAPTTSNSTTHYLYQPNVTVVKSSNPESNTVVARGSQITYTLTVTNSGDDVANYVNIADVIPTNTTYVDGSVKTSSANDASGVVTADGKVSEVQYVLYDLAVGETRTVSFTVTVNKNCQSGAFIENVAMYDNYEIEHGKPNRDDFTKPTKPTNNTVHTVEMSSDIILTGGQGWDSYLPYIGAGLILVAVAIMVIASKKKKTK